MMQSTHLNPNSPLSAKKEGLKSFSFADFFLDLRLKFQASSYQVKLSCLFMGLGQICYKQIVKGILYFLVEVAMILFLAFKGIGMVYDLFTLARVEADPIGGVVGDNSVVMLIMGVFAFMIIGVYIVLYIANIKDCYKTFMLVNEGKKVPNFLVQKH